MKKTIIAVLAAALVTAFFIGCNVPSLEEQNLDSVKKQPAPNGKVKVRINLGDSNSNARTLLPDTTAYNNNSNKPDPHKFEYFLLFVYDDGTAKDYVSVTYEDSLNNDVPISSLDPTDSATFVYIEYDDFSKDFEIDPGDYIFTIFACNANDGSEDFLAWGSSGVSSITIVADGNDEVKITLKEIIGAELPGGWTDLVSPGKFSWNIDNQAGDLLDDYDVANLSLKKIGGSAYDFDEISSSNVTVLDLKDSTLFSPNNVGTLNSVPTGYYTMVLELGREDCQTIYVQETVHIWSGFKTSYNPASLPTLRNNVHEVTFDYGSSTNTVPATKKATHGDTINTVLSKSPANTTPVHSSSADYFFYKWHLTSATGTVVTGSEYILKPIALYAEWIAYNTPSKAHYDISTNLLQSTSNITPITVALKNTLAPGTFSSGTVKVWYESTDETTYPKSDTPPGVEGEYVVTFTVDAYSVSDTEKWKAIELPVGTLDISAPKFFKFNVDWTGVPWNGLGSDAPNFNSSSTVYTANDGTLIIDILVDNYQDLDFTTYRWFVDFDYAELITEDSVNPHHLLLTLNADTTPGLKWYPFGEFIIRLNVDGKYDAFYPLTIDDN